jgi:hypothetical protein
MIISHSREFIFIKSAKTAGTSLETALSNFCSGDDVVTPLGDYEFNKDPSGRWQHKTMNAGKFEQHDWATTIRDKMDPKVWDRYFKFSIARNPWDRVVSLFTWKSRNKTRPSTRPHIFQKIANKNDELETARAAFRDFLLSDWETNDRFYLVDDQLCVDFVLKYENLDEDIETLRSRLGLPPLELPRLKSGFRKNGIHYSEYYDDTTRALVGERHRNDLLLFGYRFETV